MPQRKHNISIIPRLLGRPIKAFKNNDGWGYTYLFLIHSFVIHDDGSTTLDVKWKHWGDRHRPGWNSSTVRLNNYDFEVLDADFHPTGAVYRRT